jgi:hypothetical protein
MDKNDEQKQLLRDFRECFATEGGKRVLERLSKLCRENEPSFVDRNTHYTAYNEGKRCVILHIRKMLAKDPYQERQTTAKGNL